jgi:aminoglycoside/choline kinase family phosphotransferase
MEPTEAPTEAPKQVLLTCLYNPVMSSVITPDEKQVIMQLLEHNRMSIHISVLVDWFLNDISLKDGLISIGIPESSLSK